MKDAVVYLLSNCYFTVGPKIFCQIIGIPMGSDPVPFFCQLFLYSYESKWMNKLKKNDLIKARKLRNIFRFIDDLNSIHDGGEFDSNIYSDGEEFDSNIYPDGGEFDSNIYPDGEEFDSNIYPDGEEFDSNICPEELQLCKDNTDKHETSFLDLDIKKKNGKFNFGLFDKRDSFPFSIVRMPD